MALVKCRECGNEISTEAKTCPKCGAKNKNRKKSKASRLGVIAILIIVFYIIYYNYESSLNPYIPSCDSGRAERMYKRMFNKTTYAQHNNIEVTYIVDVKNISETDLPEDRACEVTFSLSDTDKLTYVFTFQPRDEGGYLARMKLKE